MGSRPRVAVLGTGFAGLEAAFYLRHLLPERVVLTVVSDRDSFLFKPDTIYIPFGHEPGRSVIRIEKPLQKKRIGFVRGRVTAIDTEARRVETTAGERRFDYLVVATGAGMRAQEIPGLAEHAISIWTPEDMLLLREAYRTMLGKVRGGEKQRLLFLIPPNNACPGPLYEIALMTDTWLRRQRARSNVRIDWTTYEQGYLQAFGPRLNTVLGDEFEERGVHGHKGFVVTGVEPALVRYQNGETREFDLLVCFPPYVARERFASLPSDHRGFIQVDADSRRVKGTDGIFAVGDAADFPIKMAFLALLQADAAADHIGAEIDNRKPELDFEPMTLCVLEELDRATFAQVPLEHTGDPEKPVVDTEGGDYKVGVSPVWRAGKRLLGLYVPWRFRSGEPFHTGFAWHAMDMGLKVMSKILAR